MTWERLHQSKWAKPPMAEDAIVASTIGTNGSKMRRVSVAITFGRAKVEELGIVEGRVNVDRGHDSFHGLLRVEVASNGSRRFGRLPSDPHKRLRLVIPGDFIGVTEPQDHVEIKASREPSGAILITLPKWARNYGERAVKS